MKSAGYHTSALRVSICIHHYSPPLRGIVVYYSQIVFSEGSLVLLGDNMTTSQLLAKCLLEKMCTISCKNVLMRAFFEIRWTLVVCTRKRYSAHVITSWTNLQCRHLFCFSKILKKTQTTAEKTRKNCFFHKALFSCPWVRRFTKPWGFFENEVLLCVEDNC